GYLGNIAGEKALEYDFSKGVPIGSMADENSLIYIRSDSGMTTVDKLVGAIKTGKNPPIMGGTDRASASFVLGSTLEYLNPEAKFKHVLGYPGGSEIDLALRKGEVQAAGRSKNSFFARVKDLYKTGEVAVMIQTGTTKKQRDSEFKDIPTFWEFADTEKKKQLLSVIVVNQLAARPFWLPPGTNPEITQAIRTAFLKTVENPALIADAKKSRRHVEVLTGEEMEVLYKEVFDSPEEIKATVRKLFFGK
ncbi:MAG: tripartite tricarboxylate transporter substrate-binding protein, partial [Deltaproteobacteria bacterium]|nr:tripartite tricarboxylate transporter substrate-binding protein [Deltaproteobacteria bacterium]